MKAVRCLDTLSSGVWWWPAVKSRRPNTVGFIAPNLDSVCWIFGIGQPSNPPVAALSLTKSRVSRHFPGDFRTGCTWLQWVARDSSMTPSLSNASTCVLIAVCFSAEWCLCWSLLEGSSHFVRSISITIESTFAGSGRTAVEKMSMNSRHRALSDSCNAGVLAN